MMRFDNRTGRFAHTFSVNDMSGVSQRKLLFHLLTKGGFFKEIEARLTETEHAKVMMILKETFIHERN